MATCKEGIYVDGFELRKLLKSAQFCMGKAHRIIYGTPLLEENAAFLRDFVFAYDFKEDRDYYIKKMCADFEVLKLDLRIVCDENILRSPDPANLQVSVDEMKLKIVEYVARIDEGITKWRNSTIKGKPGTV